VLTCLQTHFVPPRRLIATVLETITATPKHFLPLLPLIYPHRTDHLPSSIVGIGFSCHRCLNNFCFCCFSSLMFLPLVVVTVVTIFVVSSCNGYYSRCCVSPSLFYQLSLSISLSFPHKHLAYLSWFPITITSLYQHFNH
jgi:hypothetical protein